MLIDKSLPFARFFTIRLLLPLVLFGSFVAHCQGIPSAFNVGLGTLFVAGLSELFWSLKTGVVLNRQLKPAVKKHNQPAIYWVCVGALVCFTGMPALMLIARNVF